MPVRSFIAKGRMAKILIVDDDATNRQVLARLLNAEGHTTIEAIDGSDGITSARAERPELVISDILMPSMDGYELVRQLRSDLMLRNTPVIFYTAHYHEREARNLAQTCDVVHVLAKPAGVVQIRASVQQALTGNAVPTDFTVAADFDSKHLRLLTNKLSQKNEELSAANARFRALTELNVRLASERDPHVLLERVCHGARELLGAKYVVLAVADATTSQGLIFSTSGIDFGGAGAEPPRVDAGALGRVMTERRPWRVGSGQHPAADSGLPDSYPPAAAYLAVPVASLRNCYGWLCVADKVGATGFETEDEQLLCALGAQVGRIYESGALYREVQCHAEQLLVEVNKREHANADLRESEERFRQLSENIQDVLFIMADDYKSIFFVSSAYEKIWGRPCSLLYENPLAWAEAIHPDDQARVRSETQCDAGGLATNGIFEYRIVRPDGAIRWILARTFPIRGANASAGRSAGIATDITERKHAEARIEYLNRIYAMLSGINSLIVRVIDRDELFKEACRLAVQHGRFKSAWCGWLEPGSGKIIPVAWAGDSPAFAHDVEAPIDSGAQDDTVFTKMLRSQEPIITKELGNAVTGVLDREAMVAHGYRAMVALPLVVAGTTVGCFTLSTDEHDIFDDEEMRLLTELAGDISFALDHIEKAEKLNYLAYYDGLTGLANHMFFGEKLAQYVSTATSAGGRFALVIADLERFEFVNSTFGRLEGDQLLRELANRFADSVGDPRCVARIGGDQFAAVITDVTKEGQVARTLETWWEKWLGAPYLVNGHELRVSANAGVAVFPSDGDEAVSLLRNATAALKNAKTTGAKYLFYTSQLSEGIAQKLDLEDKLRLAFEREEFLVHYQPKVDLETKKLTGVEALIRWQSPTLGLMMPAKFIPILEETGMIAQVGLWVMGQACRDRSRWLGLGLKAPRVAVNVSMEQLRRGDFVSAMAAILKLFGGEAGIDIEVTESLMMQNIGQNLEKLTSIRDLGVGIAIDDFGTGYSSLGYLSRLPVDTLKIDRSFIMTMLDDPSAMTLISTIISLAHALKLDVVAEGVESQEQAKILRLLRCDQMQGFLISKPLAFDDMAVFLGKGPEACA